MKSRSKSNTKIESDRKREPTLIRLARQGDRDAYLDLFVRHLPSLDRFVRHEIHYAEKAGIVQHGLIDPCDITDQVYIAGMRNLQDKPARTTARNWFRFLALRIIKQQIRTEHQEGPNGLALERMIAPPGKTDTEFWEFYQPDDLYAVEDVLGDARGDPAYELERQETNAEIEQGIAALPDELRELLQLRLLEGMHADEIAALKSASPVAVQDALRKACEVLRGQLRQ